MTVGKLSLARIDATRGTFQPQSRGLVVPVVAATTEDDAIAAGCDDFLVWPCETQELELRLQRLMGADLETAPAGDDSLMPDMVGRSPKFTGALKMLLKSSASDAAVLIEGETGTGKEMAARSLHYLSARRHHPFIPVNCGAPARGTSKLQ